MNVAVGSGIASKLQIIENLLSGNRLLQVAADLQCSVSQPLDVKAAVHSFGSPFGQFRLLFIPTSGHTVCCGFEYSSTTNVRYELKEDSKRGTPKGNIFGKRFGTVCSRSQSD